VAGLGLNLTKIESQPIPSKAFEYSFHIDLEKTEHSSLQLTSAVSNLEKAAKEMRVLGFFKTHQDARN
jgi:prephenate dehydratase